MNNIANIRKRKFQAIGWGVAAVGCIVLVYFWISLGLWDMRYRQQKITILNQGERTTATIVDQKLTGSSLTDVYVIKYTFTLPSGQEQTGYYNLYEYLPSGWDVGNQITIAYDSQDPTMNLPVNAGYEKEGLSGSWFGRTGAWFALIGNSITFCAIAFFLGRKAWRTWQLTNCVVQGIHNQSSFY